jgi:hypothetical protein
MKKIILAASVVVALTAGLNTFAADSTVSSNGSTPPPRQDQREHQRHGYNGTGILLWTGWMHAMSPEKNEERKDHEGGKENKITDAMKTAITNKDYTAFVTAFNDMVAKRTTPTQDEFKTIVAKHKTMEANKPANTPKDEIKSAITANDYPAFIAALQKKQPANATGVVLPTQDKFNEMVAREKLHDAERSAITANDYPAFVKAFEANKPTVPTQDDFNKIVTLHNTIKDNKTEIKETREEVKAGTTTKKEGKEKISAIKDENAAAKKSTKWAKKPLRKTFKSVK